MDGPVATESRVVVVESWLDRGEVGDAHQPAIRRAMAQALAQQIQVLRPVPAATSPLANPPAWVDYQAGPWPVPHSPIFDFTLTPPGFEWLDHLAQDAADALGPRGDPGVIAHSDWYCGNLRFVGAELTAAYDWDSLTAHHEPVLAGVAAGAHTDGSTNGPAAPTPHEVAAFLTDYDDERNQPFTGAEQTATAAATWVMAYNARCQLHNSTTSCSGTRLVRARSSRCCPNTGTATSNCGGDRRETASSPASRPILTAALTHRGTVLKGTWVSG